MVKFQRTLLAIGVSIAITGCGGGGGGGGGGLSSTLAPFASNPVPFHTPARINSFQPQHQPHEYRTPLTEIYTQDLNGNGVDEVVWSNVAFNWSGTNWIDSQVQIFGFNTGEFKNETNLWFRPGDNIYAGGFKINFGDFNGSGFADVFLSTFTDTPNHTDVSVLLENTVTTTGGVGLFARRDIDFGVNLYSHDSVVADFNGDGIDDVLVTGSALMLGSNTGNYVTYTAPVCCGPGHVSASGVSAADFLGDGTVTLVITDGPGAGDPASDTLLYRPLIQNGELVMQQISVLPADRFFLPKWDGIVDRNAQSPHAVRSLAMDFDRDGVPDTVIISTMPKNGNSHGWTEVQFLRNDGGGVFTDVTDSVLMDFNHGKTASYNPQLIDINNDGLLDIFMSATDYTNQSSTSVLLATREGKFVESYTQVFDAFSSQIHTLTGPRAGAVQPISIVAGPNNTRYFVSGVEYYENGIAKVAVYASLIGNTGTVTAQATIDTVRQVWPWLSDADANALLAQSSTTWFNGVPVVDLNNAMTPQGGLGIRLNNHSNSRVPITGSISVPGLDQSLLNNVTAVDMFGRDFQVNLTSLNQQLAPMKVGFSNIKDPAQSWGSNFVSRQSVQTLGFNLAGDSNNWSATTVVTPWSDNSMHLSLTATHMQGSPWLNFSGVFGSVNSSTMIEASVIKNWNNGYWARVGGIQTSTDFTPGLVKSISDIYSVFATAGWRNKNWNVFGGLQPHIVHGRVSLELPSGVDFRGNLHYNKYTVNMHNSAVLFAGAGYQTTFKNHNWKLGGVVNSQQQAMIHFEYQHTFR